MTEQAPEIATLQSRIAYRNRWLQVREDEVQRADGSRGIYGVVEKPDFAVIVPVDADGSLHLVEQYRYPVAGRYWEFPQGAWEQAPDADPLDLARGELREETGLVAGRMTHLGHLFLAPGFATQGYHIFLAEELTRTDTALEVEEQGLITNVFARSAVIDMIGAGRIKDATTVAALSMVDLHRAAGRPLGGLGSAKKDRAKARSAELIRRGCLGKASFC